MAFRELKDLLGDFLDHNQINRDEGMVRLAWENSLGATIIHNTDIVKYDRGVITVKTSNPVWRNELSLRKEEIIFQLTKELKKEIIKDIRFV